MPATQEQDAWTSRVLGVSRGAAGTNDRLPLDLWAAAKAEVDSRLSDLTRELNSFDNDQCRRVAEFGIFGVFPHGETVALNRALFEFAGASPQARPAAAVALATVAEEYATALEGNPLAHLIDENPFGVRIGLLDTLGSALTRIREAALP